MDTYAAVLLEHGRHAELRQLARDMAELDLALPEVWAVMACFWRSKGNWDKAVEYIDRGLEHRKDHHGLRVARGSYLLHCGQPEAALAEFRAALDVRRDISAYYGAVTASLASRKQREALHHARAAAELLPTSASAACLLGLAHLQQEHVAAAVAEAALRRALELEPAHREASAALVSLLQHGGDWAGAAAVLRHQIARQPDDGLYVQLGMVYRDAGKTDAAMDAFQAALGLNAFNKQALQALDAFNSAGASPGAQELGVHAPAHAARGGVAALWTDGGGAAAPQPHAHNG